MQDSVESITPLSLRYNDDNNQHDLGESNPILDLVKSSPSTQIDNINQSQREHPVGNPVSADNDTQPVGASKSTLIDNFSPPEMDTFLNPHTQDVIQSDSQPSVTKQSKGKAPISKPTCRSTRATKPFDRYQFDKKVGRYSNEHFCLSVRLQEPTSYHEAMTGPQHREWKGAKDEELEALWRKHTFIIVVKPKDRKLITSKWVWKIKYSSTATIKRFKARLVARGYSQEYRNDYEETFAPTLRFESFRMLMAITAILGLEVCQMDVYNAYLEGELKEEIYMEISEGMDVPDQENKALLLLRGL